MLMQSMFPYPPLSRPVALNRERHLDAPLLQALLQARRARLVPFSTPGHKLGIGADPDLVELLGPDMFASDVWLNTRHLDVALQAAQALGADAWGADRTFYLVNGSSSGNQAFLLASLTHGEKVVVARDIHSSILSALVQTGATPIYVTPRFHSDTGVSLGVSAPDVALTLDAHPGARLVVLVSPNYCGMAIDLPAVVRAAHARNVAVFVDEAWGPHFRFNPVLPPSAIECGADAAVNSVHKLLGSLSQGAILHVQGTLIDVERIAAAVAMTQTTSPLLPILASIDTARRQMALDGERMLSTTLDLAEDARRRLTELPGVSVMDGHRLGIGAFDRTRLVIDVHGLSLTGYGAELILRERFAIAPEMSDRTSVICLVSIGDTRRSLNRLVTAFQRLSAERRGVQPLQLNGCHRSLGEVVAPGPQRMSPGEAFRAPATSVPLSCSTGAIAAESVIPYPPGVPVLMPGEEITSEKVDYLRDGMAEGMYVRGASDPTLATIRVIA